MNFNGQTTTFPITSGSNQFGARLELIGVVLRGGDTFSFSVQVENELGNSTQVDSSLVGISEFRTCDYVYDTFVFECMYL